jgi:hypothetical protein
LPGILVDLRTPEGCLIENYFGFEKLRVGDAELEFAAGLAVIAILLSRYDQKKLIVLWMDLMSMNVEIAPGPFVLARRCMIELVATPSPRSLGVKNNEMPGKERETRAEVPALEG